MFLRSHGMVFQTRQQSNNISQIGNILSKYLSESRDTTFKNITRFMWSNKETELFLLLVRDKEMSLLQI